MKKVLIIVLFAVAGLSLLTTCTDEPLPGGFAPPTLTLSQAIPSRSAAELSFASSSQVGIKESGFILSEDNQFSNAIIVSAKASDDGIFKAHVTSLKPGTRYFFMGYIKNSIVEVRSEAQSFTTTEGSVPSMSIMDVYNVQEYSAMVNGSLSDDGGYNILSLGVCWDTKENPTYNDNHVASQDINDDFRLLLSELDEGTTYYVRTYGENSKGIGYSNALAFITLKYDVPSVVSDEVSDVSQSSAKASMTIKNDGGKIIKETGFCLSQSENPTIEDTRIVYSGNDTTFSMNILGLVGETEYHIRAYAINDKGVGYGTDMPFETLPYLVPKVETSAVSEILYTSVSIEGKLLSDGGKPSTEIGICYSTSSNPTVGEDSVEVYRGKEDKFKLTISGLKNNTKYYARVYAVNEVGIGYGEEIDFITLDYSTPIVKISSVSDVTENALVVKSEVISDGGGLTERGVCWGTVSEPTTNNSKIVATGHDATYSTNITGLTRGTLYYIRSYAKNVNGTFYSDQKSVTTLLLEIPVITIEGTDPDETSISIISKIQKDGGSDITETGICWSKTPNPTSDGNKLVYDGNNTVFTLKMENLSRGTEYYIRSYASSAKGTGYSDQVMVKTLILDPPSLIVDKVDDISETTVKIYATLVDKGNLSITERGVCWSSSPNSTSDIKRVKDNGTDSSFICALTGLTANTKYYVRAYAKNNKGTGYSEQKEFSTIYLYPPTVATSSIRNITTTSALAGGNVTDEGSLAVTARGVCWNTETLPDVSLGTKTNDGSGEGTYESTIIGLSPNTTYYVRAYATNGKGTSYGEQHTFTTAKSAPIVETVAASDVGKSKATVGGNLISDGGCSIIERGICWSRLNPKPQKNSTNVYTIILGASNEFFTTEITGIPFNQKYYYCAYAINDQGTTYGEIKTFDTEDIEPAPVTKYTVNGYSFNMVTVEGGEFYMGAQRLVGGLNYDPDAKDDEQPVHKVILDSYMIGQTEVTQGLWLAVMGSYPSRELGEGNDYPVYTEYMEAVKSFIAKINQITGLQFKITTEAQFEYAARGGNNSQHYIYSGSNVSTDVFMEASQYAPIGQKFPNELGIFDMSGSTMEWCRDNYETYKSDIQTNPIGSNDYTKQYVKRGGRIIFLPRAHYVDAIRVSARYGEPNTGLAGFRLVLEP